MHVIGTVVDADAHAVPDATIWLSEPQSTTRGAVVAQTDRDGRFEIDGVRDSTCLWAWAAGWAPSVGYPLFESEPQDDVRLTLSVKAIWVRGLVVDSSGSPIAGAEVWVGEHAEQGQQLSMFKAMEGEVRLRTAGALLRPPTIRCRTDENGRFEAVRAWARARLGVFARAEGYAAECQYVFVKPGTSIDVRLALARPATLVGTIVDETGAPCAGAEIDAGQLSETGPPWGKRKAESGADGSYRIADLPPGERKVRASHPTAGEGKGTIVLSSEAETCWDVRLDKGGCIRGRLLTEGGQPLPGIEASASPLQREAAAPKSVSTDANGRFELIRCEGAHRLYLVESESVIGTTLVYVPEIAPGPQESVFVVPDAKMPTSFITGEVRDENGPVKNASIGFIWSGGKSTGARHIDSTFRVGPLPIGRYIVRVFEKGAPYVEYGPFDLEARTTIDVGVLLIEHFGSLRVSVRDQGGGLLAAHAQLEHLVTGDSSAASAESGELSFAELRPGSYVLRVTADGRAPSIRSVELFSGSEVTADVVMRAGVEQKFRLSGFASLLMGGASIRWRTAAGDTVRVDTHDDFPPLGPETFRKPIELTRSFLPGRYVLSVEERRGDEWMERVTAREHGAPRAEFPFEISEQARLEPLELELAR